MAPLEPLILMSQTRKPSCEALTPTLRHPLSLRNVLESLMLFARLSTPNPSPGALIPKPPKAMALGEDENISQQSVRAINASTFSGIPTKSGLWGSTSSPRHLNPRNSCWALPLKHHLSYGLKLRWGGPTGGVGRTFKKYDFSPGLI